MKDDLDISLGKLYYGIKPEKIIVEEKKEKKKKENWYVSFCKKIHKMFPVGDKNVSKEIKEIIDFFGWDLSPREYNSTYMFFATVGLLLGLIFGSVLIFLLDTPLRKILVDFVGNPFLAFVIVSFAVALPFLAISYYLMSYPKSELEKELVRALDYAPKTFGYITMSLKLVPNLERALNFAAEHAEGKLAEDLRKIMWDLEIGVYSTLEEALDNLALKWAKYAPEIKRAFMRVRSAIIEPTDARREELLDKTMEELLQTVSTKMEVSARRINQPAMVLFYIGVLLPVILIIILPIGSIFSNSPLARPEFLFLLYDIIIPVGAFAFAKKIISSRPPVNVPPKIPKKFPGLKKEYILEIGKLKVDARVVAVIILIVGVVTSFFIQQIFGETIEKVLIREGYIVEGQKVDEEMLKEIYLSFAKANGSDDPEVGRIIFMMQGNHDVTPYYFIFGVFLSVVSAISIVLYSKFIHRKKMQDKYAKMEDEFKESLYILASRLGENKPAEEAIEHTIEFLPSLTITQEIYSKILENIKILGLPLDSAVFDNVYGALRNNPSEMLNTSFRLLVDSVKLGVNTAARTMLSLTMELANEDRIRDLLNKLTQDVADMMFSMALFIAPMVLGITVALQKIVILTVAQIATSGTLTATTESLKNLQGAQGIPLASSLSSTFEGVSQITKQFNIKMLKSIAEPWVFTVIVAIYVLEIAVVLLYFSTMIRKESELEAFTTIAISLPIVAVMFVVGFFVANFFITGGL